MTENNKKGRPKVGRPFSLDLDQIRVKRSERPLVIL
jgi:hypothetical protein